MSSLSELAGTHDRAVTDLRPLFEPGAIAVVGVSPAPRNLGRRIVENLVEFGFAGPILPVGRAGGSVAGRPILGAVTEAGEAPDLAVILVPARQVPAALEECGRAGVRAAIVSSGGFGEYDGARRALEAEVLAVARRHGIRLVGPNCIGLVNVAAGVCTPFTPLTRADFVPGGVSLVSQSGGVLLYLAELLAEAGVGVRALVSEGNKLDLDEADYVAHLAADPGTRLLLLYMEGVTRGRALLAAAARSAVPVVALKANVAEATARIARSHTGALAGDERVVDAALRQAGVLKAGTPEDLVLCARASALPPLRGDRLAVASMSGGIAVVAADACARHGFRLPALPEDLLEGLERQGRGGIIRLGNPLDLGDVHDLDPIVAALERLLALPHVDGLVLSLPSPASAGRIVTGGLDLAAAVDRVGALATAAGKPVALSFFGAWRHVERFAAGAPLPVFRSVDEAIAALAWSRALAHPGRQGADFTLPPAVPAPWPAGARPAAVEVAAFLATWGLPVEPLHLARSPEEAASIAAGLGGPVALKLVASEVSHKTDVGGVVLGLETPAEIRAAYGAILERARARAPGGTNEGVAVQRMRPGGVEAIVGARRDPAFGPVVLFGLGGIWVEALDDVAIRVAPIDSDEARSMLGEIRARAVLTGGRGRPPVDTGALADLLVAVSRLVASVPDIVELDLNPVRIDEDGVLVLDARLTLTR